MPMHRTVPMRKCTGCNEMKPKKELIRIVKSSDGIISLDLTGKKSGRGAYICHDIKCFTKARKAKRFESAFSCEIPDDVYELMEKELTDETK